MRLSRNRNWGHPMLVELVKKLAIEAKAYDGWPGLLVGDLSQPRGGPMLTGHRSHQMGLDADIWFLAMPNRVLTAQEREKYLCHFHGEKQKGNSPNPLDPDPPKIVAACSQLPGSASDLCPSANQEKPCVSGQAIIQTTAG